MGQGTVAKILSVTAIEGPRLAHSKNWPPSIKILGNLGKIFFGGGPPRGAGAEIYGVAQKILMAIDSRLSVVQKEATNEALGLNIGAQ